MGHVFGRASARFHFVSESSGKLHAYQAADPAAFLFDAQTRGAGFSLLPVSPASLTLTPSAGLGPQQPTVWEAVPSVFDAGGVGNAWRGAFAPGLGAGAGRLVASGQGDTDNLAYSDDGGATWTGLGYPLGDVSNFPYGVAWAAAIGLFVAVGSDPSDSIMATSADGITWGAPFDPFGFSGYYPTAVTANPSGTQLVAVATGGGGIWTSTNGTVWTHQASLFDGFDMTQVRYLNGKWYVAGNGGGGGAASFAVADPSDLTTWTPLHGPLDDGQTGTDMGYWGGRLYFAGLNNSNETTLISSGNLGATWITETTPFDTTGTITTVVGAGQTGFVAGLTSDFAYAVAEKHQGGDWTTEASPILTGQYNGGLGLLHVPELGGALGEMFLFGYAGETAIGSADVQHTNVPPFVLTPLNG